MSKSKAVGKAGALLSAVLLAVTMVATSYIGGQQRAVDRYVTSIATGNLTDYTAVTGDTSYTDKDTFKAAMRSWLNENGDFPDLEENSVVGATARINSHDHISLDRWICRTKVSYYSGSMSRVIEQDLTVVFSNGKWMIEQ
ncbi:MAG: hypothetical protein IKR73_00420 [Oscillospiraceae bacterium]|nr:hypothetical protein [Oscillospiraceae bacterium]